VALPHRIATLLYCFNARDEVLLMERAQEPNLGLWSPPGGKLDVGAGESPHSCAAREAEEELGVRYRSVDFHLTGIVSEVGFQGHSHWLMFLLELRTKLTALPSTHREGRFEFFSRAQLDSIKLPQTDREMLWPLFWKHRGGFFAARCDTTPGGANLWSLEQSNPYGNPDH
jgi:8-oxo-dGTP diphosphatase